MVSGMAAGSGVGLGDTIGGSGGPAAKVSELPVVAGIWWRSSACTSVPSAVSSVSTTALGCTDVVALVGTLKPAGATPVLVPLVMGMDSVAFDAGSVMSTAYFCVV